MLKHRLALVLGLLFTSPLSYAIDVDSTLIALRLSGTITGGLMPTSDPLFSQMVARVQARDIEGAAKLAANSKYFASFLARRLALQMQTPGLTVSGITDNDATAFLISHFIGAAGQPASLSSIWSENATYTVNFGGVNKHVADLTVNEISRLDWTSVLQRTEGQLANNDDETAKVAIPPKHVGGYVTLSDRPRDNSYAQWAATGGTNLRFIEGIWEIGTGLTLMDVASTNATAANTPRFVPQNDISFFHGEGQPACLSCHGGGMSNLTHGYAAVADKFNFNNAGFKFISIDSVPLKKSLGSTEFLRASVADCSFTRLTTPCNPDSRGVDPNQAWNVADVWQSSGVLALMGWRGPTSGEGLNALGRALGQASGMYETFTRRIVNEICPMGSFTAAEVGRIAAAANPYAQPAGTDDIRTIVAKVASQPGCL